MFSLLFESFIALLLLVTIGYCWLLSKRITLLHKSRQELNKFIHDFNTAIARAEHNIDELKVLGKQADASLASHIEQARFLANDLSFLTEKGENVADGLEQQLEAARGKPAGSSLGAALPPRPPRRPPTAPKRPPAAAGGVNLERAQEIEQILTSGVIPPHMQRTPTPSKKQAMDTVLAQIALHKTAARPAVPAAAPAPAAPVQAQAPLSTPAQPMPTTAAKLNETIDRVFNKKRLEQVRQQAE